MSMAGMERGAVMRAREAEKAATRGMDRGVTMRAREAKKAAPPKFGGTIPSPKQITPGKAAPPTFGGTIPSPTQMTPEQARQRAYLDILEREGFLPFSSTEVEEPMQSGFGDLSQEEIDRLNRPLYDINDMVFGPETRGMNLIDMLVNSLKGGR
jgi:hypothetical protein